MSRNITVEQLKNFFERPGINKTGVLKEVKVSPQLINAILRDDRVLTQDTIEKLLPVLMSYGFSASE